MENLDRQEWEDTIDTYIEKEEKAMDLGCYYQMDPAGWHFFLNGCYLDPIKFC